MRQFLRCPVCNEVIPFGERFCKYCSAELSYEAAQQAAEQFAKLSEACALANNLNTMTPLAPIMLVSYGLATWWDWISPSRSFWLYGLPLAPLLTAFYWFLSYRAIQTNDTDFQQARKDVHKSLLVWIPTTIVLIVMLVFLHRR